MTRGRRSWNVLPNNWELGSVVITDPGDQPLSPDQSAFPVCWPLGLAGEPGPKMNWSPMRSTCHPIGKNGNDSSRVRQFSVVWVKTPHEKHPSAETVDAFGDAAFSSVIVTTGSQFSNIVSNYVTADRSCATGFGGTIVPNNRWMRMRRSRSADIGSSRGAGGTGVGSNLLIMFSNVSVSGDAVGICSSTVTWQTARAQMSAECTLHLSINESVTYHL